MRFLSSVVSLLMVLALPLSSQGGDAAVILGPAGTYSASLQLSSPGPITIPPYTGPTGTYSVLVPPSASAVQVIHGEGYVTFYWGSGPLPTPNPGPQPNPNPGPVSEFQAIGRRYASILASDLAAGFRAGAAKLDAGSTVADANSALKSAWDAARKKSFATSVGVELAKIVAENSTPSAADRVRFSQAWKDFASGLEGK